MDTWILLSNLALAFVTLLAALATVADMVRQHSKDIAKVSDNDTEVANRLLQIIDSEIDKKAQK